MYSVLTLNKISEAGLNRLAGTCVCSADIKDPDAVLVRSASMHEMEFSTRTLAIARAGAGVNNIPVAGCSERGIVVFNAPGANANAVRELVLCALLLISRRIVPAIEWVKTLKGEGERVAGLVEKGKGAFAGPEILGKKLGVVGLGAVGLSVANAAGALGMEVYGFDPFLSAETVRRRAPAVRFCDSLREIFAGCDYVTLHVPLTRETDKLIDAGTVAQMKDGVRILNFARGGLVNTTDIAAALKAGRVAAYATDFPQDALIGVPGAILIPHLGASTPEAEDNCAVMAADELLDYLENGNVTNSVNFPNISVPRSCKNRLAVLHRDAPDAADRIAEAAAAENIVAGSLVSRSRGEYACTLLDTDAEIPGKAVETIRALGFVIRVRLLP